MALSSRATYPTPSQKAREATNLVGPRVYHLTGLPEGPLRFIAIGCHGNGSTSQQKTAAHMHQVTRELAQAGDATPSLIVFAGDNLYDYGVNDPLDPSFKSCFTDIYRHPELTGINQLPCFMSLGNHDENYSEITRQAASMNFVTQGDARGINQTAHTYLDCLEADTDPLIKIFDRLALFNQSELPIAKLPQWNMPFFFYSIIAGNTQFFILNSNTFLKDYLLSVTSQTNEGRNPSDDTNPRGRENQFEWFMNAYQEAVAADRTIFIVKHIPSVVCGKRSFPNKYDTRHFLWQVEIDKLNEIFKSLDKDHVETQSYNELEVCLYRLNNINPHLIICAHEHFLSWMNEKKLLDGTPLPPQFTTGGGGGSTHHRESYRNHPFVGMHQQHNGFGIITCDPDNAHGFTLDVHTIEGLHLRFNQESYRPIIGSVPDDPNAMLLHVSIQNACNKFLKRLREKELMPVAESSGLFYRAFSTVTSVASSAVTLYAQDPELRKQNHETELVHDLQAYFNQHQLPDFKTGLAYLHDVIRHLPHRKSKHLEIPFHALLEEKINKHFGKPLNELFQENEIVDQTTLVL